MSDFTGNWFAFAAIVGWPLVAALLYNFLPPARATIWTILGGYLALPAGASIKLTMIPAFDKNTVPSICACIGCFMYAKAKKSSAFKLPLILIAIFLFSPVATSVLNGDAIRIGERLLPGVGLYDGFSEVLYQTIFFLPFFLGWRYFREPSDIVAIFVALVSAGLLYSLLLLYEIRMSPMLSSDIYGVSSSFLTEIRYGGYRPVVFMGNGLVLSFFMMTTVLAAIAMWRTKSGKRSIPPQGAAGYLALIVVLSKSAGALFYTIGGGVLLAYCRARTTIRIAAVLAAIALAYPSLRATHLFPTSTLTDLAGAFSEDRRSSLLTRFEQEDQLLAHASERVIFGWGRYGRNRVYLESGRDDSLTDGQWIITMGEFGAVGFFAMFGLLSLPVFAAARASRYANSEVERVLLASLSLIVALTTVEQLPNASISPWSWFLAGVLLAQSQAFRLRLKSPARNRAKVPLSLSKPGLVRAGGQKISELTGE